MDEPTAAADHQGDRRVYDRTELEWVHAFADCMREAGFVVTVDESVPTFKPAEELPADQAAVWDEAVVKCREMLGHPPAVQFDPSRLPALYEATVAAKACLESLGFTISDPPSLEAWIESYDTGPWLPHSELSPMSEAEWKRVISQCPQP